MRNRVSIDGPVEISVEAYRLLCDERLRESFKKILVERDVKRGEFQVNWRCWDVFRTIHPDLRFPVAALYAVTQKCADHGYHLVEKLPPTKQQKTFRKLQDLCQHTQSALWSGRITWLGLAAGEALLHVSELYAWDHLTIVCCVKPPPDEAASVRYFFVPANSSAFRIQMAQSEPFILRVLADPRMAMVMV